MRSYASNLEHARLRTPILLLGVLLLNVLTISGLTLYALRGQRAQLLETLRESKRHALTLLASRLEQSLLQTTQAPFLAVGELPFTDISSEERLHRVRLSFPAVEQIIFFNDQKDSIQSFPRPPINARAVSIAGLCSGCRKRVRMKANSLFPYTRL